MIRRNFEHKFCIIRRVDNSAATGLQTFHHSWTESPFDQTGTLTDQLKTCLLFHYLLNLLYFYSLLLTFDFENSYLLTFSLYSLALPK